MFLESVIIMLNILYIGFFLLAVLRASFKRNWLAAFAIFLFSTIIYAIAFYLILLGNKLL